jgi:catabolite repression HPr-like protein
MNRGLRPQRIADKRKARFFIMTKKVVQIKIKTGLEARPVALLVQEASKYDSRIYIESEGKRVNAKSIMGVMILKFAEGEKVTVTAEGADEEAALAEIQKFLEA